MSFRKKLRFTIGLLIFCAPFCVTTVYGFVVHAIQVRGLRAIAVETVRSYLPIKEGQEYTEEQGRKIIAALYRTGFFDNVRLNRQASNLIVTVKERPIISRLDISGNKAIPNKTLLPILDKLNIVEGRSLSPQSINEIKQGLQQQYAQMGYNSAIVSTRVEKDEKNRVSLYITVNEGGIVKIRSLRFEGNHVFSSRQLRQQLKLTNSGLFTFISHNDRFTPVRLEMDLQNLNNFYLNHGYLGFRVLSPKIKWSPDRKNVDITISIDEGPLYKISDYRISGETYNFKDQLYKLITLRPGDVFSREEVLNTSTAINNFLADRGYAFANVNVVPSIDERQHRVRLNFNIVSGARVYVRRINFYGNQRTDQEVLRRVMPQYEGGVYSFSKAEESKRQLQKLIYLTDINYTLERVPGSHNQVDLNYSVKEVAAGKASVQGGYSDLYGFTYGASISEPNFMGTGKQFSLGFDNNQFQQSYYLQYINPYYTTYGLSSGFSANYTRIQPDIKRHLASYLRDGFGFDFINSYPISPNSALTFTYGFEHIAISKVDPDKAAPSMLAFLGKKTDGDQNTSALYNNIKLITALDYNSFDRPFFPTKGLFSDFSLEVGLPFLKSGLGYYRVLYRGKYFQPLGAGFILNLSAILGYGNGLGNQQFPFFRNFLVGGIGSLPAFAPYSLGPKNQNDGSGALGGNLETLFGVHLILPDFISDKVRTSIIFDAGNVFQMPLFPGDTVPKIIQNDKFSLTNLRPSLGLGVQWATAFAPLSFTLAFPLNKREGDITQAFQFAMGVDI